MARDPWGLYGRERSRSRVWIYVAVALLGVAALYGVYKIVNPSGRHMPGSGLATVDDSNEANEVVAVVVKLPVETEPTPADEEKRETLAGNPEAAGLIEEAVGFISSQPSRIIAARDKLNEALAMPMSPQQRALVKKKLSELADKWLFSVTVFPEDRLCDYHRVQLGGILTEIGKQLKVPYQILTMINRIGRPEALQGGAMIKVVNGPFHAKIYRSTFTMDLYLQDTFVKSYPAGLGKPGRETPTGVWLVKVGGKLIKPPWTDPDTGRTYRPEDDDYPLGSRWISLEGIKGDALGRTGFAIHGTKKPEQIGTAGSRGCVRLHNGDVILMYNVLMEGFSRVEVFE